MGGVDEQKAGRAPERPREVSHGGVDRDHGVKVEHDAGRVGEVDDAERRQVREPRVERAGDVSELERHPRHGEAQQRDEGARRDRARVVVEPGPAP